VVETVMSKWKNFKERHLGKIGKAASWIISIASLLLAILSYVKSSAEPNWNILLGIVIFNSIFLIIVGAYESIIYYLGSKIEKELSEELKRIKESQKNSELFNKRSNYYYKYIVSALDKSLTRLLKVNYNYKESIAQCDNLCAIKVTGESKEALDDYLSKKHREIADTHYESMMKEFNTFLGNITTNLKSVLDLSLKNKNIQNEVSIAVKLFNRIVTDPKDINDVRIITVFRDNQTYTDGKREIGKTDYSIDGNTDFSFCLRNNYFLKNNIKQDSYEYENEHDGFLNFYNCTIVVPIYCEYEESKHIFGYLACDILNNNTDSDNLLDENMADIMITTANIIGVYFDNLDFQWEYILENDFLNVIFNFYKTR
jgi:hypothetical protein